MINRYGTVENAVRAMQSGATNFIQKPWTTRKLLANVRTAVARQKAEEENIQLSARSSSATTLTHRGKSSQLKISTSSPGCAQPLTVLLQGESGRARTDRQSDSSEFHGRTAFVLSNSGPRHPIARIHAVRHVKGAFTSAVTSKKGLFEVPTGHALPRRDRHHDMDTQADSAVLQDRKSCIWAAWQEIQVDVAHPSPPLTSIFAKCCRRPLPRRPFYPSRNQHRSPPLRQRREDIPLLVQHFLEKYSEENERPPCRISTEALRRW